MAALSITLEQPQWQHLVNLLSTHPYREVAPIIDAIRGQASQAEAAQGDPRAGVVPFPQGMPS
jgi:hypothetical protein